MQTEDPVDILVIGGGINGTGIARDASGRGLSVTLVEQGDLAEGTSSRSGKLIHGGLRYLEYYEFRLVREALFEREVLLQAAPHIIWPLRFVLPHSPTDRPAWLVRAGLLLYDYLGGRKRLPPTRSLKLHSSPEGLVVKPKYNRAFEYSDCWVDDSRLVSLNALSASEKGAEIRTRTRCVSARREGGLWHVDLQNTNTEATFTLRARAIVNAAGPWVNDVIENISDAQSQRSVRLVKGSHLVVRKFWDGDHCYLIQNDDKRVIFINPYESEYALIGTTDIPYSGDPADVKIDEDEIDYLLNVLNRYFINQFSKRDIVSSFSGVRPLYDDNNDNPSAVTRDYIIDIDDESGIAPLMNIFGGKITTFRKLSGQALNDLSQYFPNMGGSWTATEPLPGGDIDNADFDTWLSELIQRHQSLPEAVLRHYGRLYGSRADHLLRGVTHVAQLGKHFGHTLFEVEARFLVEHEWAQTANDILQRRTKYGLRLSPSEVGVFADWFDSEFRQSNTDNLNSINSNSPSIDTKYEAQKSKYENTLE